MQFRIALLGDAVFYCAKPGIFWPFELDDVQSFDET
jgi:hypothetical protein